MVTRRLTAEMALVAGLVLYGPAAQAWGGYLGSEQKNDDPGSGAIILSSADIDNTAIELSTDEYASEFYGGVTHVTHDFLIRPSDPNGDCVGDIDGDGDTDQSDLCVLLHEYGWDCEPPQECHADLDDDGYVGLQDLQALLLDFGCGGGGHDCDDPGPGTIILSSADIDNTAIELNTDEYAPEFHGGVTHFTYDLQIQPSNPDTDWCCAEVSSNLTAPDWMFFRHPTDFGGVPPPDFLFSMYPALEFDTYWTVPVVIPPGGSGIFEDASGGTRNDTYLNAFWSDDVSGAIGAGIFTIHRFTIIVPAGSDIVPQVVPAGAGGGASVAGTINGWLSTGNYLPECIEIAFDIVYIPLTIIHVDDDADGNNDGSTWEHAFNNLQSGITAADDFVAGGGRAEIWAAAGVYAPAGPGGDPLATFQLHNDVPIYGGFDGSETEREQRDPALHETILSGDLNGDDETVGRTDNCYHVVTGNNTDESAILDGFTITAGNAMDASYVEVKGAGMIIYNGAPTISNCLFIDNVAFFHGGALYCGEASPKLINCRFVENSVSMDGGAVYALRSDALFVNCMFRGNACGSGSNGGGAMTADDLPSPTLINCTLSGNSMPGGLHGGGGILVGSNAMSIVTLTNCILWGNSDPGGTDESAQIHLRLGMATVNYCCIQGLTGGLGGAGNIGDDPILVDLADPRITACSPCIDIGDDAAVPPNITLDLAGNPRIMDGDDDETAIVDLGAYEFTLPGDLDGDCAVNLSDLAALLSSFEHCVGSDSYNPAADYNCDGCVKLSDLATLLSRYNHTCE